MLQTHDSAGSEYEIAAKRFINAAGLSANAIARSLEGFDDSFVPPLRYAKGNYFSVTGRPAFSRLIYPVPEPGGLGVHLTLDLNGSARVSARTSNGWTGSTTRSIRAAPTISMARSGNTGPTWPTAA